MKKIVIFLFFGFIVYSKSPNFLFILTDDQALILCLVMGIGFRNT